MDYLIQLNKPNVKSNKITTKEKLAGTQISKSDFFLNSIKKSFNAKNPFLFSQDPMKKEWKLNNPFYYNIIEQKNQNTFINKKDITKSLFNDFKNLQSIPFYKNFIESLEFTDILTKPIIYKTYFEYTKKSPFESKNLNSNFFNLPSKTNNFNLFQLKSFNRDLYETINLKKWSFIAQISFLLIFVKNLNTIKKNYQDSFRSALENFFFTFEFNSLTNLKSIQNFIIQPKKIKFSNLIEGTFVFEEFIQTILVLRTSRKPMSQLILPTATKIKLSRKKNLPKRNKLLQFVQKFNKKYSRNRSFLSFLTKKAFNIERNTEIIFSKQIKKVLKKFFYVPKGFLIVGPPGSGKKLLIQTLAGEADMPIIYQSGEKLFPKGQKMDDDLDYLKGALQIKKLFNLAKTKAPCILFLDQVDRIAQNRKDVLTHLDGEYSALTGWNLFNKVIKKTNYKTSDFIPGFPTISKSYWMGSSSAADQTTSKIDQQLSESGTSKNQNSTILTAKALSMLTQLLCELDGIKNRKDIVVIGTTTYSRPSKLDPALLRPGRLEKLIYINPPRNHHRFKWVKCYMPLEIKESINWNFFADHTTGLSPAHLTSIINLATHKSIYQNLNSQKFFKTYNKFFSAATQNIDHGIGKDIVVSFKEKLSPFPVNLLHSFLIQIENTYQARSNKVQSTSNFWFMFYQILHQLSIPFLFKSNVFEQPSFYISQTIEYAIQTICYQNNVFQYHAYLNGNSLNSLIFGKNFYNKMKIFSFFIISFFNLPKTISFLPIWKNEQINLFHQPFNKFSENLKYSYFKFLCLDKDCFKKISYQKKNLLNETKKQSRQKFYKKHQKYIRTIYILKSITNKKQSQLKTKKLFLFNSYINRLFKIHLFGCQLLINSTCFIKNDFLFSLNPKTKLFNNQHLIQFRLLSTINNSLLKTNLTPQLKNFNKKFGDAFCINRAIYYLSGKALILNILKEQIFDLKPLSLWTIIQQYNTGEQDLTSNKFLQQLSKQFVTKIQFENYLLSIIAGKVAEIILLKNIESNNQWVNQSFSSNLKQIKNKKISSQYQKNKHSWNINDSNIGVNELQQLGWVFNILIKKNFFYKSMKIINLQQINIQLLQNLNDFQIQVNEQTKHQLSLPLIETYLNILTQMFDQNIINSQILTSFNRQTNPQELHNISLWNKIPYLWELKSKNQKASISIKYGKWENFFNDSNDFASQQKFLPKFFIHNYYFHNLVNNLTIRNNIDNIKSTQTLLNKTAELNKVNKIPDLINKKKEKKLNSFENKVSITNFNKKLLTLFFQKSQLNWNNLQLNDFDSIMIHLLFESFNKSFNILEKNHELLDLFAYYFLCNERLYKFEIKSVFKKYYY